MKPLWQPDKMRAAQSQMTHFQSFAEERFKRSFLSYNDLHHWSVTETAEFWEAVWYFCEVKSASEFSEVVRQLDQFPGTQWFTDSRLNFAENLLAHRDDQIAIIGLLENGERSAYTYAEVYTEVERLASAMRRHGITNGDRVAGLLPNIPEAVIAILATTSIGAIWSSCSPDFGVNGACDRFGQIEPRLLFTTESYLYNGKTVDCLDKISRITQNIESIEATIVVPSINQQPDLTKIKSARSYEEFVAGDITPLKFKALPFDHPLYIMYSSGTTGTPKCIVHSAGGTLLQHLKEHKLHTDISRDDTLFYFTTCGWMMWNWLVSGLTTGGTILLYDGSPFASEGNVLLDAIDSEEISVFGVSAKYLSALEKQGAIPRKTHRLDSLKTILSTGSPLNEASYEYVYRDIKTDVCLSSISGGTDIISCFMLGNPNLPVYSGEIQCPGLGMAVAFWDKNKQCEVDQTGELVCTVPFPSVPIGFWNDPEDAKFLKAYFTEHPGVWTHGDYGAITQRGGIVIQGRSDAVLNPSGVRIGTAEIYRQVETIKEVVDSIAVGQEWQGDERIILFVVLQSDLVLDDRLIETIKLAVRQNTTPRHVPAKIIQVSDIPRTISGKIVELAVRNVIHGRAVNNTDALSNPEALEQFKQHSELAE